MDAMEERVRQLEKDMDAVKFRNAKVESEKAWEISWVRRSFIAMTTYIIVAIVFLVIGVQGAWLNALIPAIGYILSVQSLPFVKRWWMGKERRH